MGFVSVCLLGHCKIHGSTATLSVAFSCVQASVCVCVCVVYGVFVYGLPAYVCFGMKRSMKCHFSSSPSSPSFLPPAVSFLFPSPRFYAFPCYIFTAHYFSPAFSILFKLAFTSNHSNFFPP